MATQRVTVVLQVQGQRQVQAAFRTVGQEAKRAGDLVRELRLSVLAFASVSLVREVVQLADSFTTIGNRLRIVTRDQAELNAVQGRLVQVANNSRQALEPIVDLYSRIARSARGLSFSQNDLISTTDLISKAIAASGATAQEARAGLIQFAQGLASNRLQGDELRAVFEQLPVLANAIANGMGVSLGTLRKLGSEGKLTGEEVLRAIQKSAGDIENLFASVEFTVANNLNLLANQLLVTLNQTDSFRGAIGLLNEGIVLLSQNMNILIPIVGILGSTFAALITVETLSRIGMLFRFLGFLNPFRAMLTVLFLLASAFVFLADSVKPFEGSLVTVRDLAQATARVMRVLIPILGDQLVASLQGAANAFASLGRIIAFTFDVVVQYIQGLFQRVVDFVAPLARRIGSLFVEGLRVWFEATKTVGNFVINTFRSLHPAFESAVRIMILVFTTGFKDVLRIARGFGQDLREVFTGDFVFDKFKDAVKNAKFDKQAEDILKRQTAKINAIYKEDVIGAFADGARALFDEMASEVVLGARLVAGVTEIQAEVIAGKLKLGFDRLMFLIRSEGEKIAAERNKALGEANLDLPVEGTRPGEGGAGERGGIEALANLLDDILGPAREYKQTVTLLNIALEEGTINLGQYSQAMRETRIAYLETQRDMESGLELGFLRFTDSISNFAEQTADILEGTFNGALDALTDFIVTGEASFEEFVQDIQKQLTRLALNQLITAGLSAGFNAIGGGLGAGSFGATATGGSSGSFFSDPSSLLAGFATGGSFRVGGSGGTDSQMVAFRATPGEQVTVETPGQQKRGQVVVHNVFHITTQDARGMEQSQAQMAAAVGRSVNMALLRNG